ncbi:MAG: hypothetical protein ACJASL_000168 [Paraglaciecola sp.]
MRVLVACEYSGRVRDAFRKLGHDAMSCDLLPSDSPLLGCHYQGDVFDIIGDGWDLMIAHPPCTRLANSGVRWLRERDLWDELVEAAKFYNKFQQCTIKMKCIENPIMHKYAKAMVGDIKRQVVQPWWFGEKTFKATGYELTGLPDLVATNKLNIPEVGTDEHKKWSWIHRASPSPDRWKIRSTTPQGIANAMAEQWGGQL